MADRSLTFNLFGKDVSASKAVGEFSGKAKSHISGLVKDLAGLALGYFGVTSVIDFGEKSVEAAMNAQTATVKLNQALENTKSGFLSTSKEVSKAKDKMADYGFTGADVSEALAKMTTGLGDGQKALDSLQVTADLAKYKNLSLADAAAIVTKGWEGQIRPLKQLGIDIPVYTGNAQAVALANKKVADAQAAVNDLLAKYPNAADTASKHHDAYAAAVKRVADAQQLANDKANSGKQIIDTLTQKLHGQAADAANTYAGQWAAISAKWDEIQVKAGNVVLPALSSVADFLSGHLIPGIEEASKKMGDLFNEKDVKKQSAQAESLWNQFWAPWGHGWDQLMSKFGNGWSQWMQKFGHGWDQMTAKNPWTTDAWSNGWNQLMGKLGNGWNQLMGKLGNGWDQMTGKLSSGWEQLTGKFSNGWSQIQSAFSHGASQIVSAFSHGWQQITDGWNSLKGSFANGWQQIQDFFSGHPIRGQIIYSNVVPPAPSGGGGGSLVARPTASGGIFQARSGGHLLQVAEAGQDEGVIPLTPENLKALSGGGGGGSGVELHVHIEGAVLDNPAKVGRIVFDAFIDAYRQGAIPRNSFVQP